MQSSSPYRYRPHHPYHHHDEKDDIHPTQQQHQQQQKQLPDGHDVQYHRLSSPSRRRRLCLQPMSMMMMMTILGGATGFPTMDYNDSEGVAHAAMVLPNNNANSNNNKTKCTDIVTCREIGEQKDQERLERDPIIQVRVSDGSVIRYKRLQPGVGTGTVREGDVVDMIFSISRASGAYMYSIGFGYDPPVSTTTSNNNNNNIINIGGGGKKNGNDLLLGGAMDSYRVTLKGTSASDGQQQQQQRDIPVGIEKAMIGMKRGERRRIELPPGPLVGFESSNWKPEPITRRGKAQISDYQSILKGRGSSQPPFPAPTIWDVEVLSFRSAS
jgi:hypothetical protein